jgi:RNA polymerase sigma-70 factor (ECF subfamily)
MNTSTDKPTRPSLRDRLRLPAAVQPQTDPAVLAERRAAFGRIVARYESDLLRSARRFFHGEEDRAQDLVQDTLLRAYRAYREGRVREDSHFRAWLLRILTNTFINDYRHRQKWEATETLDDLQEAGACTPPSLRAAAGDIPGHVLLETTLDEPLEKALAALPEGWRLCVLLVDVEGLDYAETAAALAIPIGTVRSRLSRARLQLHQSLYEYARNLRRTPGEESEK